MNPLNKKNFILMGIVLSIIGFSSFLEASDDKSIDCEHIIFGNKIKVEIKTGKFRIENHKIEKSDTILSTIDGRKPIGTPVIPNSEIKDFKIYWNGSHLELPDYLYKDCYELNLRGLNILPSQNKKMFMLQMNGSDGAYAYDVYWVFDRFKVVNRFIWQDQDQFNSKEKCSNNFE